MSGPNREEKEFDEELFQKELRWLKRIKDGETVESNTSPEILPASLSALIVTMVIGAPIGALVSYLFKDLAGFILILVFVFASTFYLAFKPYAVIHLDKYENHMQYEGGIVYAGEENTINYRGPIEVIEGVQLVKHQYFRRHYIRLITNSGYMRLNFDPINDRNFLLRLEEMKLLNLEEMMANQKNNKIISTNGSLKIIYDIKFDRSEFKIDLKEKKMAAEKKREIERVEKKRLLIEKSKRRNAKQ